MVALQLCCLTPSDDLTCHGGTDLHEGPSPRRPSLVRCLVSVQYSQAILSLRRSSILFDECDSVPHIYGLMPDWNAQPIQFVSCREGRNELSGLYADTTVIPASSRPMNPYRAESAVIHRIAIGQ